MRYGSQWVVVWTTAVAEHTLRLWHGTRCTATSMAIHMHAGCTDSTPPAAPPSSPPPPGRSRRSTQRPGGTGQSYRPLRPRNPIANMTGTTTQQCHDSRIKRYPVPTNLPAPTERRHWGSDCLARSRMLQKTEAASQDTISIQHAARTRLPLILGATTADMSVALAPRSRFPRM